VTRLLKLLITPIPFFSLFGEYEQYIGEKTKFPFVVGNSITAY